MSVGRLGIITEVEFDIIPQQLLTRLGHNVAWTDFQAAIVQLQNDYNSVLNGTSSRSIEDVLDPWEGTQVQIAQWYCCPVVGLQHPCCATPDSSPSCCEKACTPQQLCTLACMHQCTQR